MSGIRARPSPLPTLFACHLGPSRRRSSWDAGCFGCRRAENSVVSHFLIQCVKIGRGYFTILREETAMKKRQQQLEKLKEEELNKFQPAKKFSDIQCRHTLLTTYDDEKLKLEAGIIIRPFTPVHSCIISSSLPESHVDPLYRQLCALHWLLEALTIDHTHHTMRPLIACWNPKDPGGAKSTIKKVNKDKSMGQRWDHFVTAPKTKKFKIPAIRTASRKPSRKGSTLSLTRTSGGSSPQSSMISVNPGSDEPPSVVTQATGSKDIEDNESWSTKQDEETLHNLHTQGKSGGTLYKMAMPSLHGRLVRFAKLRKPILKPNKPLILAN
ncbi:hypothetical protein HispidOSU_013788 [Sigmodon hispidus]